MKKEAVCQFCIVLTQDQKARLSTPCYQKKKEKRDQKAIQEESSSTLVDTSSVTILGVVKDRQGLDLEEMSSTLGAKIKKSKGLEESSSSNVKDKKTDTPKEKVQDWKAGLTG